MSSYRVVLSIGALAADVLPESVVPAASAAASAFTTVEAAGVAVVRGEPRITVRFSSDGDQDAAEVATAVIDTVRTMSTISRAQIIRLTRGTWIRIHDV